MRLARYWPIAEELLVAIGRTMLLPHPVLLIPTLCIAGMLGILVETLAHLRCHQDDTIYITTTKLNYYQCGVRYSSGVVLCLPQ